MGFVRRPAVAGTFYPDDPRDLELAVGNYLRASERLDDQAAAAAPKGTEVPKTPSTSSSPGCQARNASSPPRPATTGSAKTWPRSCSAVISGRGSNSSRIGQ